MCPGQTPLGLRERKKLATREALADAALRMAADHGMEQVTVEAVTARVGVSVRTFFNYFPTLEDAFIRPDPETHLRTLKAVREAPAGLSTLEVMREAIARQLAHIEEDHDRWQLQVSVLERNPSLLPRFLAARGADEKVLIETVAAREGCPPTALYPRLVTHVAVAAVRAAVETWAADRTASFQDLFRQAFDLIATGLSR
ncbi:TetR family transcriptional regulator [Streptomyces avicenniae]|uniref:acyl-CoA-like ligand-binding transcription factor n=1 Tax=Streptomyces avicenniae TaxID=500153 RepID=UPI00069BFCD7|nr:TetR family transcriptional regulator [Streptomyces avicenniae]